MGDSPGAPFSLDMMAETVFRITKGTVTRWRLRIGDGVVQKDGQRAAAAKVSGVLIEQTSAVFIRYDPCQEY